MIGCWIEWMDFWQCPTNRIIPFVPVIQPKLNVLLKRCSPSVALWQKVVNDVMINYNFSYSGHNSFLPVINKELSYHQIFLVQFVIGLHFLASKKYGSGEDDSRAQSRMQYLRLPTFYYTLCIHVIIWLARCHTLVERKHASTWAERENAC